MDRAKNAMYAQAGRSPGWNKVQDSVAEPLTDARSAVVTPVFEPPFVELPFFEPEISEPVFYGQPGMVKSQEKCQELAIGFVKMQKWRELYEAEHGFSCGTIFAELDLPWMGKGGCKDE